MTSPPADDEYDLAPLPRHATALFVRALWATAKVALLKLKGSVTEVARLTKHISGLDKRIAELEHRLALDSHNSSKPPSTDPLYRKPSPAPAPSLEDGAPKRSVGGQPGHAGATLRQVTPDEVIICALPPTCPCGLALNPVLVGRRQVFDTPQPRLVVTEFHVYEAQCACGKHHQSEVPAGVNAPVQYGPVLTAQAVLLTQHHAVPLKRCAEILGSFTGQSIQSGTINGMVQATAHKLTPVVLAIRNAVVDSPVVHADETGMRVGNGLTWLHAAVTERLTWIAPHKSRGLTGMRELGLLDQVRGTLVHDGLAAYREFETTHALCNAHHLRELVNIVEETQQPWATDMIDFLLRANALVRCASGEQLPELQRTELRAQYGAIVAAGMAQNPLVEVPGKRGRAKQSDSFNLLRRLREFADDVLRFIEDPDVPFTNNLAERAMRMPKVKQKVSGCFRTDEGIAHYCTLRSYLATLGKQGLNLFDALAQTAKGTPMMPSLVTPAAT